MLKEGDKAPKFELPSDGGGKVKLSDFKGKKLVLYFYPRDMTPGCTREAQSFSWATKKLAAAGASVVGVSKDTVESHEKFRDKLKLGFPLLSDTDLKVHEAYGAYGEKSLYGKKVMGTIRSTFIIDEKGVIAKVFSNVKVDGHTDAVLSALTGEPVKKKASKGAQK